MSDYQPDGPAKNDYTFLSQYANFGDVAGFGGRCEESARKLGTQPFVGPARNATDITVRFPKPPER